MEKDARKSAESLASALPLGPGVRVLKSQSGLWVALEKPIGVMTHPNGEAPSPKALLRARYDRRRECYFWQDEASENRELYLIHRLDSPTSGVLLACFEAGIAKDARNAFAQRKARKVYHALVVGRPRGPAGLWVDRWQDKDATRGRGARGREGGGQARAHCEIVGFDKRGLGITAIRLTPQTGRTHQLRIQCQRRDAPIVGDQQYGRFRRNRELAKALGTDRLFLHALEIDLEVPQTRGRSLRMRARATLPPEFSRAMGLAK